MVSQETIDEVRRVSEDNAFREMIESYDLPTRGEIALEEERVPLMVHRKVRDALHRLLMQHPAFSSSGIGYSEFIAKAIERALREERDRGW